MFGLCDRCFFIELREKKEEDKNRRGVEIETYLAFQLRLKTWFDLPQQERARLSYRSLQSALACLIL